MVGAKVVKTAKLDEVLKLLQEAQITCAPFEELLEKTDAQLRQIEKEVDTFLVKTRSSQLFDCEAKLKKVGSIVELLQAKIQEVLKELGAFSQELAECDARLDSREALQAELEDIGLKVDGSALVKERTVLKLQQMLAQVARLDRKNVNLQECAQIMGEASELDADCQAELDRVADEQERLRRLLVRFREQTKAEAERQRLLGLARQKLRENRELVKQMKTLVGSNAEKASDFDTIYKAMLQSEDYSLKKPLIEKKARRLQQLRQDV